MTVAASTPKYHREALETFSRKDLVFLCKTHEIKAVGKVNLLKIKVFCPRKPPTTYLYNCIVY